MFVLTDNDLENLQDDLYEVNVWDVAFYRSMNAFDRGMYSQKHSFSYEASLDPETYFFSEDGQFYPLTSDKKDYYLVQITPENRDGFVSAAKAAYDLTKYYMADNFQDLLSHSSRSAEEIFLMGQDFLSQVKKRSEIVESMKDENNTIMCVWF